MVEDEEEASDEEEEEEEEEEDVECNAVNSKPSHSATASTAPSAAASGAASASSNPASSPPSEAASSPSREEETAVSNTVGSTDGNQSSQTASLPGEGDSSSSSAPPPGEAPPAGGYSSSSSAPPPGEAPPVGGSAAASLGRKKGGVTFSAHLTDYDVVMSVAESRGWRVMQSEEKTNKCNVLWIDKPDIETWLLVVQPWMKVNHFPGMNQALARKTRLARNMARMQKLFPKDYKFLPPTWVLPDQESDLRRRFNPDTGESKSIFISKPDHLCQGRGIFLTTSFDKIKKAVTDRDEPVVVQQYIGKPMLIDGMKFDLRLYFLVCAAPTESGGLVPRCFLFRDGLVRLCTTAYQAPTEETMSNRCMHLTNYAINKKSSKFEQNNGDDDGASGSKRSLKWFMNYVEQEHGERERKKLWQKLAGLCVKMILAVFPTLEAEVSGVFPKDLSGGKFGCRCFEVLGVDVMLDRKLKPYLIEVNHLPSFTCDSPLDEDIKGKLIEQTLDLTCSGISGSDKQAYDVMARERAEARPKAEKARRGESVDSALRGGYNAASSSSAAQQRRRSAAPSPRRTSAASPPPGEAWPAEASAAQRGQAVESLTPSAAAAAAEPGASSTISIFDMLEYRDFERVYPPTPANSTTKQAAQIEKILERVSEVFRPVNAPRRLPKDSPEPPPGPLPQHSAQQRPPRPPGPGPGPSGPSSERRPRPARASASLSPTRSAARSKSAPGPGPPRCAMVGLRVVEKRLEAANRARSSSAQRIGGSTSPNLGNQPLRVALPLKLVSVTL